MDTYDLHLRFGIRETECQKTSAADPQGCMYRKGFFVASYLKDLMIDMIKVWVGL